MRTTLALLALSLFAAVPPPSTNVPTLETRITVKPVTKDDYLLLRRLQPDMYRCSVFVQNTETHELWHPQDVVVGPGENDKNITTVGPFQIEVKASISKKVDSMNAQVTVMRAGKIVSRQVSSFLLEKPAKSF